MRHVEPFSLLTIVCCFSLRISTVEGGGGGGETLLALFFIFVMFSLFSRPQAGLGLANNTPNARSQEHLYLVQTIVQDNSRIAVQ